VKNQLRESILCAYVQWIASGSTKAWPPSSPDLTPMGFSTNNIVCNTTMFLLFKKNIYIQELIVRNRKSF
jgi:hypothetical protein